MASWKKGAFAICAIGLLLASLSYGTPLLLGPACRTSTAAYLAKHPITGWNIRGERIPADPNEIEWRIAGPFEVQTSYYTLSGMHADIHSHTCTALPWRISLDPRRTLYLM